MVNGEVSPEVENGLPYSVHGAEQIAIGTSEPGSPSVAGMSIRKVGASLSRAVHLSGNHERLFESALCCKRAPTSIYPNGGMKDCQTKVLSLYGFCRPPPGVACWFVIGAKTQPEALGYARRGCVQCFLKWRFVTPYGRRYTVERHHKDDKDSERFIAAN